LHHIRVIGPSSNALLGSGLFPLRRHLDFGFTVGLDTDVGAGTGFSMFNEGLMAYHRQMLSRDDAALGPADLLRLARRESIAEVRLASRVVFSGAGA
jgi:guanine deaminase